jgi:hypothetical protein
MFSTTTRIARLTLACGVFAATLAAAHAQVVGPPRQLPIGGGTYSGPGDTVPPGSGGTGPGCSGLLCGTAPTACGTPICTATWTPAPVTGCFSCICDDDQHPVQAYHLTLENLRLLACNSSCTDASGNISVEITGVNACQASVFLSRWLIHGSWPNMPISATVPVLACVNGQIMCNPGAECTALGVNCREVKISNCLECASATVTLTFNRDCMCTALNAWFTQMTPAQWNAYKNTWMLHVAFTKCTVCD